MFKTVLMGPYHTQSGMEIRKVRIIMNVYILPQILKGKMSFEECKLFPCYVYLFNNL